MNMPKAARPLAVFVLIASALFLPRRRRPRPPAPATKENARRRGSSSIAR